MTSPLNADNFGPDNSGSDNPGSDNPGLDNVAGQLGCATLEVLRQLAALIGGVGRDYGRQPRDGASSIGRHVRHILDHFAALQAAAGSGRLDYNARNRDDIVEVDAAVALARVDALVDWLQSGELADRPLEIESEVSVSRYDNVRIRGSLHREVIYVINHTIHHIAYAKTIAVQLGIDLDDHLGLAPATATYLRSTTCTR